VRAYAVPWNLRTVMTGSLPPPRALLPAWPRVAGCNSGRRGL
jgi:hypothetical protein